MPTAIYKERPQTIEAIQFDGTNAAEIIAWHPDACTDAGPTGLHFTSTDDPSWQINMPVGHWLFERSGLVDFTDNTTFQANWAPEDEPLRPA